MDGSEAEQTDDRHGGQVIERERVCAAWRAFVADGAGPSERGQAADGVADDRLRRGEDGDAGAWYEVREGDIVTELGYRPGHTYPARIVHRVHAAQAKEGGTGVRRLADYRLRGGEENQEVRHPQATDAGAQAQACAEGGHQGDLREGGEGGGEARTAASSWRPPCPYELHRRFEERVEGGEGLARQGSQGLDLSQQQLFSVAIKDR